MTTTAELVRILRLGWKQWREDDYDPTRRDCADAIERLEARVIAAEAEQARLERLVYVPGLWKCAKCDFTLTQRNLNSADGSVTVRDVPGYKCRNCGSPLWRVTERQAANEMIDTAYAMSDKLRAAEAERDKLREALRPFAEHADWFDEIPGAVRTMDDLELWQKPGYHYKITVGDLRRARAALAALKTAGAEI